MIATIKLRDVLQVDVLAAGGGHFFLDSEESCLVDV